MPGKLRIISTLLIQDLSGNIIRKANEEVNTQISYEGHIIHSQESFHSRTPSEYTIETIEPTELTSITYECLEKMYSSSEKMQRLGQACYYCYYGD